MTGFRSYLFLSVNLGFIALVGIGLLHASDSGVHPLYLVLLFAMCSSPILLMTRLNDRYAVLAAFSTVYFMFYGALDFVHLLSGTPAAEPASVNALDAVEIVILVGYLLAHAGYRVACRGSNTQQCVTLKDWPERTLLVVGMALWIISTWLVWKLRVEVLTDVTIETQKRGFGNLSGLQLIGFMLASYFQPLCIIILAYAQCRYRRAYMIPLLAIVLVVQMIFGFVANIKGQVLIGFVLVALTKMLIDGTIPKSRFLLMGALIAVIFPVLQANRELHGDINDKQAAQHFVETLEKAIALAVKEKDQTGPNRAQSFLERMTLKGSVATIVQGTGAGAKYQNGYTLVPLIAVFIPRIIWPDKPDVQTGRVMNGEFHISEQEETYISPSHLGELYWNFGWWGVLLGMPMIGLLFGFVGKRCDLSQGANLTRILILVGTIQVLVLGFESAIAPQYSVWLRSVLAIGLLHWVLARRTVAPDETGRLATSPHAVAPMPVSSVPSFQNLMR